jgi:hypothetical protein
MDGRENQDYYEMIPATTVELSPSGSSRESFQILLDTKLRIQYSKYQEVIINEESNPDPAL